MRLSDARLSWFNGKSVAFARDLSTRAYCYDRAGRMVSHYLERNVEERYYGFGEKSGAIGALSSVARSVQITRVRHTNTDVCTPTCLAVT